MSEIDEFRSRLDLFCFFHLGSDAEIVVETREEGVRVVIAHRRVTRFEFLVSWAELPALLSAPLQFEEFMLKHLTRNRISG